MVKATGKCKKKAKKGKSMKKRSKNKKQ